MCEKYYTVTVTDKFDIDETLSSEEVSNLRIKELDKYSHNHFGDVWTCGLYKSLEDAKYIVENNVTDIQEGCYGYAIIEDYNYGTYPHMNECWLYKWDNGKKAFLPYKHNYTTNGFQGFTFYN